MQPLREEKVGGNKWFSVKRISTPWKMADLGSGAGNGQDKLRIPCAGKQERY